MRELSVHAWKSFDLDAGVTQSFTIVNARTLSNDDHLEASLRAKRI